MSTLGEDEHEFKRGEVRGIVNPTTFNLLPDTVNFQPFNPQTLYIPSKAKKNQPKSPDPSRLT